MEGDWYVTPVKGLLDPQKGHDPQVENYRARGSVGTKQCGLPPPFADYNSSVWFSTIILSCIFCASDLWIVRSRNDFA